MSIKRYFIGHFHDITKTHRCSQLSTILYFEAINKGVEHCQLRFQLSPATSASLATPQSTSFSLSVFQLEYYKAVDENTVFRSDPRPRMINLGDINITPGLPIDWRQSFNCAQNSVLAFELVCTENEAKDRCSIEWWQHRFKRNPNNGELDVFLPLLHSC